MLAILNWFLGLFGQRPPSKPRDQVERPDNCDIPLPVVPTPPPPPTTPTASSVRDAIPEKPRPYTAAAASRPACKSQCSGSCQKPREMADTSPDFLMPAIIYSTMIDTPPPPPPPSYESSPPTVTYSPPPLSYDYSPPPPSYDTSPPPPSGDFGSGGDF